MTGGGLPQPSWKKLLMIYLAHVMLIMVSDDGLSSVIATHEYMNANGRPKAAFI